MLKRKPGPRKGTTSVREQKLQAQLGTRIDFIRLDWKLVTDGLEDRLEHMLQQRHCDNVTQPAGYAGSPQILDPYTANVALSDCVLPSSPTRSYGMTFENWTKGIPDKEPDIDPSLGAAPELEPQEPNPACPDPDMSFDLVASGDIARENWESQSCHSRASVGLDAIPAITCTPPNESNAIFSGRFDQPSNSDPLVGSVSADIETHL